MWGMSKGGGGEERELLPGIVNPCIEGSVVERDLCGVAGVPSTPGPHGTQHHKALVPFAASRCYQDLNKAVPPQVHSIPITSSGSHTAARLLQTSLPDTRGAEGARP